MSFLSLRKLSSKIKAVNVDFGLLENPRKLLRFSQCVWCEYEIGERLEEQKMIEERDGVYRITARSPLADGIAILLISFGVMLILFGLAIKPTMWGLARLSQLRKYECTNACLARIDGALMYYLTFLFIIVPFSLVYYNIYMLL